MESLKMNLTLETLQSKLKEKKELFLKEYIEFLKFETISAQKEYQGELVQCSKWLEKYFKRLGFETEIWETSGPPTVYGEYLKAGKDKPTLLMYQHYDVQPVDPLNLWKSPPFEPHIEGDKITARGASDNKGQAFYVLMALELIYELTGEYPLNIKLLFEGEEENASKGLFGLLKTKQEKIRSDYLSIVDVNIPDANTPALNMGARGLLALTLELTGSNTDLHSGLHGGVAYNPLRALSEALSACYDKDGKVTIPHFYEGVKEYSDEEKKELYLDFDEKEYEKQNHAVTNGGEKNFSPQERSGIRPTFEINGIWGGYNEEGFKTVIPAKAFAKVSMRLVGDQDPEKIYTHFKSFFQSKLPDGIDCSYKIEGTPAKAFTCPFDSKIADAATKAYEALFDKPCKKLMGGGSLPIGEALQKASEAQVLCFGLALDSDQVHAPNENFSISRLEKGALIVALFLQHLSE